MDIVTLPDYFKSEQSFPVQLIDYHTNSESSRQKVNLTYHTFSFLTEGKKEVLGNEKVSIQNTHFLLMRTGHCLMTERISDEKSNYRSMLLFFNNESLLRFVQKNTNHFGYHPKNRSIYSFEYDNFIKSYVKSLEEINKLEINVQSKLLSVKLEELLLYLLESVGSEFLWSLIKTPTDSISHFKEVIESNKLNKLSIKELAFLSNMSTSTFKREFEKHFQTSPSKWFQEQRLEYAAFLIKNELKRASDIYEEIGYENLSNFIHAFKNKFGVTPKQY